MTIGKLLSNIVIIAAGGGGGSGLLSASMWTACFEIALYWTRQKESKITLPDRKLLHDNKVIFKMRLQLQYVAVSSYT